MIRAYKRNFLETSKLLFKEGILHEDNLFTPLAFYHANTVAEIPAPLYYYRIREGSKMQDFTIKQIRDKLTVNNLLADFFLTKKNIRLDMISRVIASDYISLHGERVKNAAAIRSDRSSHRKATTGSAHPGRPLAARPDPLETSECPQSS